MASRIESTRRSRVGRFGTALVAFAIGSVVAWLLVVDSPAAPSPLLPFCTMVISLSTC